MNLRHLYLKYFQAPLRILNFIEQSTRVQNYVMFSQVQAHLKRNKNQVSQVLRTLVDEELVIKERKGRYVILYTTELGKDLLRTIRNELQGGER